MSPEPLRVDGTTGPASGGWPVSPTQLKAEPQPVPRDAFVVVEDGDGSKRVDVVLSLRPVVRL